MSLRNNYHAPDWHKQWKMLPSETWCSSILLQLILVHGAGIKHHWTSLLIRSLWGLVHALQVRSHFYSTQLSVLLGTHSLMFFERFCILYEYFGKLVSSCLNRHCLFPKKMLAQRAHTASQPWGGLSAASAWMRLNPWFPQVKFYYSFSHLLLISHNMFVYSFDRKLESFEVKEKNHRQMVY